MNSVDAKELHEAGVSGAQRERGLCARGSSGLCRTARPDACRARDIKTAVSEAVTNAVVHAYPDAIGTVQVRVRILPDERLEIAVKDHGVGIADVAQARTPMYTTGGEERSGMGFTIMESFMDTLRVKSVPGRGTTVTMCRRIRRRA